MSWPGPADSGPSRSSVSHFAVRETGVSISFHLEYFFARTGLVVHRFREFEELTTICQRHPIDCIMIGGVDHFIKELELIRRIKSNVFLDIIPIMVFHPKPDEAIVVACYQGGAEDFVYGDWREKLVQVRIERVLARSRRDLSVNPSTHLPGPGLIEREVARQIEMKLEFAFCYADLDNFKAYNDYYGYVAGDSVIRLTARIIKDVVFDYCREAFVGHVAGDDFVFIIPHTEVHNICSAVIQTFDRLIPYRYADEDRLAGKIKSANRRGDPEWFALLTMSIAVLVNRDGMFRHVGEMSRMLADLKAAAKMRDGSNYLVERRLKY